MLVCQALGDQAVLIRCASESDALRVNAAVRSAAPAWLVDVVQAYTTVAVFFSLGDVTSEEVSTFLSNQSICPPVARRGSGISVSDPRRATRRVMRGYNPHRLSFGTVA